MHFYGHLRTVYLSKANGSLDMPTKSDSIYKFRVAAILLFCILQEKTTNVPDLHPLTMSGINIGSLTPTSKGTTDIMLVVLVVGNYKHKYIRNIVRCSYQVLTLVA
jgi:hypothetical protein